MKSTIQLSFYFIILLSKLSFSQELSSENYFFPFYTNEKQSILIGAKNCYIRESADANSKLLDSLQLGNEATFLNDTKIEMNIKGLNLSWIQIEYKKNNQTKKGYLWKGFVALNSDAYENFKFITSIDRKFSKNVKTNEGYQYDQINYGFTLKLLENNNLISEKSFSKPISDNMTNLSKTMENWGLKDINFICRIGFLGEACAVPSEYLYFGWNGKELLKIIEKYDVGDANAFYHSEELIFPKEKRGQENTIIKKSEDAVNEDDSLETTRFTITEKTELYSWNGKESKLIKTIKKKPYKKKFN